MTRLSPQGWGPGILDSGAVSVHWAVSLIVTVTPEDTVMAWGQPELEMSRLLPQHEEQGQPPVESRRLGLLDPELSVQDSAWDFRAGLGEPRCWGRPELWNLWPALNPAFAPAGLRPRAKDLVCKLG